MPDLSSDELEQQRNDFLVILMRIIIANDGEIRLPAKLMTVDVSNLRIVFTPDPDEPGALILTTKGTKQ